LISFYFPYQKTGKPCWMERICTVDLLVLVQISCFLYWNCIFSFFFKQPILIEEVNRAEPFRSVFPEKNAQAFVIFTLVQMHLKFAFFSLTPKFVTSQVTRAAAKTRWNENAVNQVENVPDIWITLCSNIFSWNIITWWRHFISSIE